MIIKELEERYGVKKKSLYRRMSILNISLDKDVMGRSYANLEQIKLLDEYAQHLKEGGNKNSFTALSQVTIDNGASAPQVPNSPLEAFSQDGASSPHDNLESLSSLSEEQDLGIIDYLQMLLTVEMKKLKQEQAKLSNFEELEKAIEREWLLSSAQVKKLIGVTPKGEMFERGSFKFIRCGKIGRSTAWKVEKVSYS